MARFSSVILQYLDGHVFLLSFYSIWMATFFFCHFTVSGWPRFSSVILSGWSCFFFCHFIWMATFFLLSFYLDGHVFLLSFYLDGHVFSSVILSRWLRFNSVILSGSAAHSESSFSLCNWNRQAGAEKQMESNWPHSKNPSFLAYSCACHMTFFKADLFR